MWILGAYSGQEESESISVSDRCVLPQSTKLDVGFWFKSNIRNSGVSFPPPPSPLFPFLLPSTTEADGLSWGARSFSSLSSRLSDSLSIGDILLPGSVSVRQIGIRLPNVTHIVWLSPRFLFRVSGNPLKKCIFLRAWASKILSFHHDPCDGSRLHLFVCSLILLWNFSPQVVSAGLLSCSSLSLSLTP